MNADELRAEVDRMRADLMRIRDCYPTVLASDDATDVASWFISQVDNVLWGKPVLAGQMANDGDPAG